MIEINKIAKKKNLKVIEDCAQAHGTKIYNKHVGNFSDVCTFSFFPGKNLGAIGDAGAILTNSKKIYDFCLRCRNHGAKKKYDHTFSGRNSRLDTIQALILNVKLKNYNNVLNRRNKLANFYMRQLKNVGDIKLYKLNFKNIHSFHQFVIRTKFRDKLRNYLKENNIETIIHYPYMLNELKFFKFQKNLKNSYKLGKNILSLPISEEHTFKELKYIIKTIKHFFKS